MIDGIFAIGDVSDIRCWSGIPYHFWRAAQRMGDAVQPGRLDLSQYRGARYWWNLRQALQGRGVGGYQYSAAFLDRVEAELLNSADWRGKTILSFHHHFPRASSVRAVGARIVYYLDATLAAELDGHALIVNLPQSAAERGLAIERENLAMAHRVITMARWLRDYLLECALVPPERLSVVLPGANLDLPNDWAPQAAFHRDVTAPFVFGVVGNDWRRKGLPLLIEIARWLRRRGLEVKILVVGNCPPALAPDCVEVQGSIDKLKNLPRFIDILRRCDLGCLFSEREAFGISVLEFLRVGVPVAGFAREGPADSIPPDAGLRFAPGTPAESIAQELELYIREGDRQIAFRRAAAQWSRQVTWERCWREVKAQLGTEFPRAAVQPWRGLISTTASYE